MSMWTYVYGTIEVDTHGRTQPECKYLLDTILAHLPEIPGSEGPAEIYTIQERGHNWSSTHNEFDEIEYDKWDHSYEHQSEYIIVIDGKLRDTNLSGTTKALMNFLCRLSKRVYVRDICIKATDYMNKPVVITDPDPFQDMRDYENDWSLYLRWDWRDCKWYRLE